jgi:hypothetical protein
LPVSSRGARRRGRGRRGRDAIVVDLQAPWHRCPRSQERLSGEHSDTREMRGESVEGTRIACDDDGVGERGSCYHHGVDRESGMNVPHSAERHACSLGCCDRCDDLGCRENFLADVASTTPPFGHDRQRDEDSCPASVNKLQEARRSLLAALGRDQGTSVEYIPRDHATRRPRPRLRATFNSRSMLASSVTTPARSSGRIASRRK